MVRRLAYKPYRRRAYKPDRQKYHNEAVDRIAEHPEILDIKGLNSETLLHTPLKFPELKKPGQETGDLIFVFSPSKGTWVILVIELQVGDFRSGEDAVIKLEMSRSYFKKHWREFFRNIELKLPPNCILLLKTFFVSYTGKFLWDEPYVEKKKTAWLRV